MARTTGLLLIRLALPPVCRSHHFRDPRIACSVTILPQARIATRLPSLGGWLNGGVRIRLGMGLESFAAHEFKDCEET
jgi:hypothetical protein